MSDPGDLLESQSWEAADQQVGTGSGSVLEPAPSFSSSHADLQGTKPQMAKLVGSDFLLGFLGQWG